jgi:hypothetical protein
MNVRNKLITIGLWVLLAASPALAFGQTATFTWVGSTDSSQLLELATINGQPVNQATGYGGAIQIVNGSSLWLLELPESLGFPNNGFLDCETAIAFGAKQWGTRSDGSQMDGTQAGDYYTLTGTTSCPLWNGTTSISITEFREMIQHRSCGHGVCKNYLVDTMENGSGSATVD